MRARLFVIIALAAGALVACGDDDTSAGGAKQTKISAAAYPTVAKFVAGPTNLADPDKASSTCDGLAEVADTDKVAAVFEKICRKSLDVIKGMRTLGTDISFACQKDLKCLADESEPKVRDFLEGLKDVAATQTSGLEAALEPGACLDALRVPAADIAKVNDSLDKLSGAMDRLRAGDRDAVSSLLDFNSPDQNPAPCKP